MNTKKQWDDVWSSKGILSKLVNFGREIYNLKLISILNDHTNVDSFCELGCGSSSLLVKISKFSKKVVGIDYSKQAFKKSRKLFDSLKIKNAELILDDCRNLKINERFDTVWSQGLVEHFEDSAKIVQEHLKITKKGGHTIISVPYKYSYMYVWYIFTRPKIFRSFWPWTEQIFFTKPSLERSLKKYCSNYAGYKIKRYPLFGIIVLKVHKKDKFLNVEGD